MEPGVSARRRRILDVARLHFERFGFKRAVVDDIVRDVGIAKGSFYLEFRSKDGLFVELVAGLRKERDAALAAALSGRTSPADKLEAALRHILESEARFPLLARVDSGDPEFLPHVRRLGLDARGDGAVRLQALVKEGLASGELRPELDAETTASVLESLGGITPIGSSDTPPALEGAGSVDAVVDLVLHGLLDGKRTPTRRSKAAVEPGPITERVVPAAPAPEEAAAAELPAARPQRGGRNDGWAEWEGP